MSKEIKATVVLPTTGDRGSLLKYSVGSIQSQTVKEIEIFIIGDGVSEKSEGIVKDLISKDNRIKFFVFEKHTRRGEVYRHQALQKASGTIVCYLCDRDLMLPDHIETMIDTLKDYNFASTTYIDVKPDKSLNIDQYIEYFGESKKIKNPDILRNTISLSNVGHKLDLYHKLPFGWRTTPPNEYTDCFMWAQFLAHPDCKAYSHFKPTILYFKRGHHPGWGAKERLPELTYWKNYLKEKANYKKIQENALVGLLNERIQLRKKLETTILVRGYNLKELFAKIISKITKKNQG